MSKTSTDPTVKADQVHRPDPSKGKHVLRRIGDGIIGANNKYESMASNELVMQTFSAVKDGVSNFVTNSRILMSVLDEVATVHPVIQGAVALFKVGLQLEITRRENNDKVTFLNITMCDMMQVLTMLKQVANPEVPGPDGYTIEYRLKGRMDTIMESIKRCAKVCDSYDKRNTAAKFCMAFKWRAEFAELVKQFETHKAAILSDLQIHVSISITKANVTLSTLSADMGRLTENVGKLMEVVFERMRSLEEGRIAALIAKHPGGIHAALQNSDILEEVFAALESRTGSTRRNEDGPGEDKTRMIAELRKEVGMEVEQVLAENNKSFEQKFEAMRKQVDEVKQTIRHQSDRIIDAVLSGPHDRIIDCDMHNVWKEMGWKGSVKVKHFVMALRDHFIEGRHNLKSRRMPAPQLLGLPVPTANMADRVNSDNSTDTSEDRWALEYITVVRVQPLIEALDEDVSSWVTVSEVNAFTAARPLDWSLPHWISYWMYGFEMTVQWYFRRIRKVFAEIHHSSNTALPSNFTQIAEFVGCWQTRWAEDVLSGLREVEEWDDFDWEDDHVFRKFKSYVVENERRMERGLRGINYHLDAANTLTIVAGEGRPEKYVLPLIFLLMRRALWIIKQAASVTIDTQELGIISSSLDTLSDAIYARVHTLKGMYKLQNQSEKDQLKKFFYGLYRYTCEEAKLGPNWLRSPSTDSFQIDEDVTIATSEDSDSEEPVSLFFGPQTEKEDALLLSDARSVYEPDNVAAHASETPLSSLVGHWSGAYAYHYTSRVDGPVSFVIEAHGEDGSVRGSGTDSVGPFTVKGTLVGDKFTFLKAYAILQHGIKVSWQYQGMVNKERDEITGTWRRPDDTNFTTKDETEAGNQESTEDDSAPSAMGTCREELGTDADDNDDVVEEEESGNEGESGEEEENGEEEEESGGEEDGDEEDGSSMDDADTDDSTSVGWIVDGGTFFLKRRPLEYLLACPSDEEFAENRPRALWKLALKYTIRAIRSRTLTSIGLAERRRQRQRYIELIRFEQRFHFMAREWNNLVKEIHPNDLRSWRCMAMLQHCQRDDPVHQNVACDSCGAHSFPSADGTTPFSPSRYLCIDCSVKEVDDSIDLCADCFSENKSVIRGDVVHIPTHNILQLRTTRLRVYRHTLLSEGSSAARLASTLVYSRIHAPAPLKSGSGPSCVKCREHVKEKPFWYCIDCRRKSTFVCCKCNSRVEEEKPWLVQCYANADYHNTHDWSHTLVFVPDPDVGGEADLVSGLSTEQRLARVEEKLEKQSVAFTSRLAALKELLERLVS